MQLDLQIPSRMETTHRGTMPTRLGPVPRAVLVAFPLVSLAPWLQSLSSDAQAAALVVGVLILGVPHGALDHLVARSLLAPRSGRWWSLQFGLAYLTIAGAVLWGWLVAAPLTLVSFLVLSILHFGADRRSRGRGRWLDSAIYGSAPVVLPCFFYAEPTATIFRLLAPATQMDATTVLAVARPAAFLWGFAALWSSVRSLIQPATKHARSTAVWQAVEWAALAWLFALLPPLLGFGAYFCLIHSVEHLTEMGRHLGPERPLGRLRWLVRQTLPLTAATVVLGLLAAPWVAADLAQGDAALRLTFWGLAALTVPHMLLLFIWNHSRIRDEEEPRPCHGDGTHENRLDQNRLDQNRLDRNHLARRPRADRRQYRLRVGL